MQDVLRGHGLPTNAALGEGYILWNLRVEMVTHHADKDPRMNNGDEGVQSIFAARTSGHILTGPVAVCGAEPGDILEVRILDLYPRPSKDAEAVGKTFGANLATGGGFLDNPLVATETKEGPRATTIVCSSAKRPMLPSVISS